MKAEAIVNAITEQIVLLNDQPLETFSGDTLSRIAVRLAAYKAGLGRYSTIAKHDTWNAEKTFKLARAEAFKQLRADGKSATDAQELKLLDCKAEYEAYIEAQRSEDEIVSLSFNVHDLIDSIKSRVINQQMEMRESHGQT